MSPRCSIAGISPNGTRTGVMSLTDMPSILRRSKMKTSCVDPGQMPTFLPLRSLIDFTSEPALAITPMPLLHMAPTTTTGSPAAPPRMAAAMPKVPKSTDLVTTAFLPSVGLSNTVISTLKPAGANFS